MTVTIIPRAVAIAAVQAGALTSDELAEVLEIKVNYAQVLMHNLARDNIVRWTGEVTPREPHRRGRLCYIYELVA